MGASELALIALNLLIATIYAVILWVMVQQRQIMDEELKAMRMQLREAERTRMAAHRPVLRVEPPVLVPAVPPAPPVELYRLCNIGVGVALEVVYFLHEWGTGVILMVSGLDPVGAGEFSREFFIPYPQQLLALDAA